LKKATDKIANAIFLDKNLLDSIIRDLQRALIEADVNIALVKELSDKIRKSALDERIKGIEKKEHLIKLLHDELVKILGEYKQLKLSPSEQNRILLLGLYGAGKCVHEETKIQTSKGEIIKAKDLYDKYSKKLNEENIKDGKIINIENENILVPSFNPQTQKIEDKKATHLWKLNKKELFEVYLDNGNDFSIRVTPEHPFFVLRNGKVIKINAEELTEQDYVSLPSKIDISGKTINLSEDIKEMNLDVYLMSEEINKYLPKDKNLKEICKNLKHKRNYSYLTHSIKNGKIPVELINLKDFNLLKIKGKDEKKIITIPLFLTSEFSEFLGYVLGDGYLSKRYIGIANENKEIINRVIILSKLLFNITPTLTRDKRTKSLYQIRLNSKTLVNIFKIFGLKPGKKGKQLEVPKQIIISKDEIIRSFIRAYFDCDSYPNKNKRYIELTSESQILIQQINILLRRFGILCTISKKLINEIPYWRLSIKSRYSEYYADKIGYEIKRKQDAVNNYKTIGILQGSGNQDMIPLGKTLKVIRLQLGFSIGEIQSNAVYSYGIYEKKGFISKENLRKLLNYYKLKKRGFIWSILQNISDNIDLNKIYPYNALNGVIYSLKNEELITFSNKELKLTDKSRQMLKLINKSQLEIDNLFESLEKIAESNISWLRISKINKIENSSNFVYDLTVEDNHSFIAEGFIVHNTTTIAKLGNWYAKRGKKVALVGLDVHRPAAKEQLQQLGEKNNLNVFVDFEETDALKTWKKFEKEKKFRDYDLILIDTAGRHNLDKELIQEIKSLGKEVKPTETILIMPADIGQAAKSQASDFQKALNISGVIITRMDSTAKAGGALTACAETKTGVYFITNGEKINDIEEFNPEHFLSRMLGMGDLHGLLEKIKSVTDEKKQEKIQKKLEEGKLSLEDVIEQVKSMNQIGGFDKIKNLIPGLGNAKIPENLLENQEEKIKKWEHILKSMTPEERANPELLKKQTSRIARIAKGSGVNNSDVRSLLKQYDMLQDMLKGGMDNMDVSQGFSQKQMQKMMKKFGKKKMMRF